MFLITVMKVLIFLSPFIPTLLSVQISFLILKSQDFYVVPWMTQRGIFLELRNYITPWSGKMSQSIAGALYRMMVPQQPFLIQC